MKKLIENVITLISASVCLIGGIIWALNSHFDYEPVILIIISALTILGYFLTNFLSKNDSMVLEKEVLTPSNKNEQKVEVNVNVGSSNERVDKNQKDRLFTSSDDRNAIIESKKSKTHILFIDDDTKFNIVQIFKDSGWKNTKTVKDVKSIDLPVIQISDIIFVDINGVGKLLMLEYEGLDLAQMLKEKYPEKKVVIYSAKKDTNAFHKAWDIIDARIEKNALPIQFQNVAENYCLSNN